MSAVGGGQGALGGRRARIDGDPVGHDEVHRIGRFAAAVLDDLYAVVYGERPVCVNVWCHSSALLMVLRLAGPADIDAPPLAASRPCEAIPELVATAVRAQTGWELAVGSWSVEEDLGLAMVAFRLPQAAPTPRAPRRAARAIAAAAPSRRSARQPATHVPAWRSWTPVPAGGVVPPHEPAPERRRLRLVEE